MITVEQATQYLDQQLGVTLPSFIVAAAVARVGTYEPAMITAGYTADQIVLLESMATAIVACGGIPRRTSSQHAASGAARSFKYTEKDLSALRRSIQTLDPAGILAELLGPDPTAPTMFDVVC
jgi:hypothetical protein